MRLINDEKQCLKTLIWKAVGDNGIAMCLRQLSSGIITSCKMKMKILTSNHPVSCK